MDETLHVTGRNHFEADVSDVVLNEQRDVRLVFRPKLVRHDDAPESKLNGRPVRQKRHKRDAPWRDLE